MLAVGLSQLSRDAHRFTRLSADLGLAAVPLLGLAVASLAPPAPVLCAPQVLGAAVVVVLLLAALAVTLDRRLAGLPDASGGRGVPDDLEPVGLVRRARAGPVVGRPRRRRDGAAHAGDVRDGDDAGGRRRCVLPAGPVRGRPDARLRAARAGAAAGPPRARRRERAGTGGHRTRRPGRRARPPPWAPTPRDLASLVRARMGEAVLERLVRPVAGGIHSADPADLAVDAVMPGLRAALAEHCWAGRPRRRLRRTSSRPSSATS
ncbi:hypothetical protein [Georgenia sp. SUBG003]|uniref:hypothetical protein n=1 Tax=Georgenia sp. SUBG003 TaxID=1497974 RepID=UPI003AB81A60